MEKRSCLFKNPNHLASLNSIRESGLLCDVTIKVNDREFRAHKIVLAVNLKYFQSMFLNSFKENKQDVIVIKNVDGTYLEDLIFFAYTGEIIISDTNVMGLLKVANYLSEDSIKEACILFLKKYLKAEDAFRVYNFANGINCLSLKTLAKQMILSHFKDFSQTAEFFNLDCEGLKKILRDSNMVCASQQRLFEGVMLWILYDVKKRRVHIDELLNFIDITKFTANYLMGYICEIIEDQGDIAKDIMFFYRKKMQELKSTKQTLMIIGVADNKLKVQFYELSEKKWGQPSDIMELEKNTTGSWAILNNKFYYTIYEHGSFKTCLRVFNPSGKKDIILTSKKGLSRYGAMCSHNEMLYFCGGQEENRYPSDQFWSYDPRTNIFEALTPMGTRRWNTAAIIYQGCLLVLGGYNGINALNSVEKYDFDTKKWTILAPMCKPRYHFGVAVLDGKVYVCGGYMECTAEVYDPSKNSWQTIANVSNVRMNFLLVAHEGILYAIGGDFPETVELYDPNKNQWKIDQEMCSGLKILLPSGGFISSSCAN